MDYRFVSGSYLVTRVMEGSLGLMKIGSMNSRMRSLGTPVRHAYQAYAIALMLVCALPLLAQTYPVGRDPGFTLFDGTNIWVSNRGDNTVMKLRSSDGTALGTFPVGAAPTGMAFDGANIWVANRGIATT